jgi:hypothetical protein
MHEGSRCNRVFGMPFSKRFVLGILAGQKVCTWRERTRADVGALLWVRETYTRLPGGQVLYRADQDSEDPALRWRPSIHLPRKLARIWLQVTARELRWRSQATEDDAREAGFADLPAFLAYPMPSLCILLRFQRCEPPPVRQLSFAFDFIEHPGAC